MELLRHELFKIFIQKSVLITFFAFAIFMIIPILIDPDPQDDVAFRKNVSGEITEERIAPMLEQLKVLEKKIESKVDKRNEILTATELQQYDSYRKIASMSKFIKTNEKLSPQQVKLDLEKLSKDSYAYKEKLLEYEMIQSVAKPSYENNRAWSLFIQNFKSVGSTPLMVVLVILGLASIFAEEYSTGMTNFILSSKNRKKIITAKLLASTIFILVVNIFITAFIWLSSYFLAGTFNGGTTNIQSILPFLFSPYNLQVWEYVVLQFFISFIGSLGFGLVIILLSLVSRSSMITFFVGGVIYALPVILYQNFGDKFEWMKTMTLFSYGKFVSEELLDHFKAFNIFGMPILYPYVAMSCLIVVSGIILWFVYRQFSKQAVES